ncbi:MAG: PAS domain S-box protein [Plectolyngbya sp. WJT66-NPBG17]|jgi:two-component system sensor histidine kinase/response regulator|nr:PAS domain S-box protein [Plectolyngbya sp. WJT66-NPBG17]
MSNASNSVPQLQREDLITVLETAVDPIGIADAEGRTLYINPATRRVHGFGEDEDLYQKSILDYHPPDAARALIEEALPIALRDGVWMGETRLLTTDGREIPTSQVIMTHKNPDGSLKFVSSMTRDITQQKEIEEQLRRSNALLKAQQEASIDGILVADEHRNIVDYNQKFCEIWRLPQILPAGNSRQIAEIVADQVEAPEAFLANIEALYQNLDEVLHDEILLKDGRTIERHSKAVKSSTGEYYGRITFFRDITERRTAEEALRRSEERYRAFVTATAQAVWMTNAQGEVVEDIPLWCALTGRSEESAKGWGWLESIHPDDRASTAKVWLEAVNSGKNYEDEQRVQVASGEYRLFAVRGVPIFDADGKIQEWIGTQTDITDQKKAEEALRQQNVLLEAQQRTLQEKEVQYRTIFEAITDALFITDMETSEVVEMNPAAYRMHGYTYEEFLALHPTDFVHPDSLSLFHDYIATVKAGKEFYAQAIDIHKDGHPIAIEVKGTSCSYKGKPHILAIVRDISERKAAEEALRRSELKYRNLFEAAQVGIYRSRLDDGLIVEANPYAIAALGYDSADEIVGKKHTTDFYADLAQRETVLEDVYKHGKVSNYEMQFRHRDGSTRWGLFTLSINPTENTSEGVFADITQRKQTEEALRRSELKYRHLFENSQVGIGRTRIEDGLFLDANQRCADILRLESASDLIGKRYTKEFQVDREARQIMLDALQQNGEVRDLETQLHRADGSIGWGLFSLRPSSEQDCFEFVIVDISDAKRREAERKAAEAALQRRAEFDNLLSQISRQFIDQDAETAIQEALELITRHIGAERGCIFEYRNDRSESQLLYEWCGENIAPLTLAARGSKVREFPVLHQQILAGESLYTPNIAMIPDCPERQLFTQQSIQSLMAVPMSYRGNVTGFMGVDTTHFQKVWTQEDIETLKRFAELIAIGRTRYKAEADLRIAKEAAEAANLAKSTFLANMSHELRTPLNAILGFAQLMERDVALSDRQRNSLTIINRSGEHLLDLINDVLEMSKIEAGRTTLNLVSFDLHHLLHTLQEMFLIRAKAKQLLLNFTIAPNFPQYVQTDENKLRQVLINLLSNAMKFTETGSILLEATVKSETTLQFKVQDTGQGIAPEEFDQLFRPFIQTRSGSQLREGTGLGLTISRRFIRLMGGDIQVESTLGQGSRFSFEIQIALANSTDLTPMLNSKRVLQLTPDQKNYRILVVDDRAENREFVEQLLSMVGFETRSAINGEDAIAQWQQWQPHLILMDMRMPVMDGYEAARKIRALESTHTRSKILALTASAFEEQRASILAAGCDDFLAKPFREAHLFEKLAEHLGVKYVYEEETTSSLEPLLELTREMLDTMPPDWVAQLHQASLAVDADQILQLIQQIPESKQQVAIALTELVQKFCFDELTELSQLEESIV